MTRARYCDSIAAMLQGLDSAVVELVELARKTPTGASREQINALAIRTNAVIKRISDWGQQRYGAGMNAGVDIARAAAPP